MAGKYSGAAYSAALSKSENTLSALESDLQKVKQVLNSDAKLQEFISNPTLSHADKEAGVEALLKNTKEATTKQLLEVLNENGRLADAGKVIEEFEQIMSAHRGEVTITVTCSSSFLPPFLSRRPLVLRPRAGLERERAWLHEWDSKSSYMGP